MDGAMETRVTRASKRRRISPPIQPSPTRDIRSTSPDELASDPNTPLIVSRRASTPSLIQPPQHESRSPSFSPVSRRSSPDELDHTAYPHTFSRTNEPYRPSSFIERARQSTGYGPGGKFLERQPSPPTPEYSRISTPLRSPEPEERRQLKEAVFAPYTCKRLLTGHKRGVGAVRISKDGKLVASASADATVRIWDLETGKCLQILEGHLAGISALAWSPDSEIIASGSDDKSIWLWNISTGKPYPYPLIGHHHYIYSVAFSPKGNILVSGSYDEAVILWDVRTRNILRTLPAHSDPVGGVDFIRDGTLIVSCAGDGLIRIWDSATGQCLRTLVHEDNAPVTSVRFSPNGKFVLAWTLDSCIRLWNYVEGKCVKTYQGHRNEKFSLGGAFGVYGGEEGMERRAYVCSGSEDGRLLWWDVVTKEVLGEARGHEGVVLGVDTGLDGLLVTCGVDKAVRVWEREEGKEGKEEEVMDIDVEGDGEAADVNGVADTNCDGRISNGHDPARGSGGEGGDGCRYGEIVE